MAEAEQLALVYHWTPGALDDLELEEIAWFMQASQARIDGGWLG
jgi:Phage P2 GpE